MKNALIFGLLLVGATIQVEAQTFSRYIVRFKNKAATPFSLSNPSVYLSQRAIDRRSRYGISIDSTDLPVTPRYLDSIRLAGAVQILNISRWLNQVSIQTTDAAALVKINSFSFVESAAPIAARKAENQDKKQPQTLNVNRVPAVLRTLDTTPNHYDYGLSLQQLTIHNGQFLHNIGLRGDSMIIGMLDAGFLNYQSLRAFDSVNRNGQVLGTYDFVARETSVAEDDVHGMQCFSVIAANIPGKFVGTAPKASFYLFRTEEAATEYPIEEHNWVCGAERVDTAGGDVLSSSLGYSDGMNDPRFDHTYAEMNGKTTIAAKGASIAVTKGLLVLNAAGNQGNSSFRYIATPADAVNVLAVGAVTVDGQSAAFSSYGPSVDGRVKPDIASVGVATVVQTPDNTIGTSNGTSFACPNMAGLATCLWQGFREFSNLKIFDVLRRSGSKAEAPDDRVGYGIPDVKKALLLLLSEFSTASASATACKNTLTWTSKDLKGMRYEIERRAPGETSFTKIGEKAASANIFSTQSHQFSDSLLNVQAGTITYRIRQVIDTSLASAVRAGYIDTITVNLPATCTTTSITNPSSEAEVYSILSNPVYTNVGVRISTPAAVPAITFRIVNSSGSMVFARRESKGPGLTTFELPVSHLAKGSYYVVIYNGDKRAAVRKFIKL